MEHIAKKIYTKRGIVTTKILPEGKILHIGSGSRVLAGADTVDVLDLPGVKTVHDLDIFPWPYEDNSYDLVYAHNVVEHLEDQIKVMEEIWRLLKPHGRLVVAVPYFRSIDSFNDPTHEHFFTSNSMNFYLKGKDSLSGYRYTDKQFKVIGFWFGWPQSSLNILVLLFKYFIHKHKFFYDQYLSLLFPVKILVWELEVLKD